MCTAHHLLSSALSLVSLREIEINYRIKQKTGALGLLGYSRDVTTPLSRIPLHQR